LPLPLQSMSKVISRRDTINLQSLCFHEASGNACMPHHDLCKLLTSKHSRQELLFG